MTFMIVASPCAVVLATMPPLLAAIANAGRHGVLIKSAVALEDLRGVDTVAFDKTGTLTHGTPVVTQTIALADLAEAEVLSLAAAVEQPSEHPIARAVVDAAHAGGLHVPAVTEFQAAPGRGVAGRYDGRIVRVGSPALLEEAAAGQHTDATTEQIAALESAGHTVVVVVVDERPVGLIALTDQVRDTATMTVARLAAADLRTVLLTGDHELAARQVGAAVGVGDAYGGLLPDEKAEAVTRLKQAGQRVMLVGDGINDAPAMATADVAVAMGRGGSDLAVETADVILVHDDIVAVPTTMQLARRAHRVVKANIVFAACVITALVIWDFAGHLPLPLGVAGHEGSTVVVGLNGLRLLRKSVWRDATADV
jgi:heavy metal translocating P-type ATPase